MDGVGAAPQGPVTPKAARPPKGQNGKSATPQTPRAQVDSWRRARISDRGRVGRIAEVIDQTLKLHGGFICQSTDGICYLFDGEAHRLYRLLSRGVDPDLGAFVDKHFGLLYTEKLTRHVVCHLETLARENPDHPTTHRFAFFDKAANVLYVSRYNGQVFRLDGKVITTISNGAEVLFLDDDGGVFVEPEIGPRKILRKMLIDDLAFEKKTSAGAKPEEQRVLLEIYLYALAFLEHIGVKPILVLEGEQDSGKTTTMERIQLALRGLTELSMISRKVDEEDLMVALLRSRIFVADNVDGYYEWLAEFLSAYATGAGTSKRKRYSDTDVSKVKPDGFVVLTTRNPASIARSDTANRLIILRLATRAKSGGHLTRDTLVDPIVKNRPQIYGEWLFTLNQIVAEIPKLTPQPMRHRLADFERFAYCVANILGYDKRFIDVLLDKAQAQRDALVMENDALADLLDAWLANARNVSRLVTAAQLYSELCQRATMTDIPIRFKSPKSLARHLNDNAAALEIHFGMKRNEDKANHQAVYSFKKAK
jgi:hypothetical protein